LSINRFYIYMLTLFSLVLGYLALQVLMPFLSPLAWAAVLSILFYPMFEIIRKRIKWKSVASIITLVIILMTILGPFSYLSFLLATELTEVVSYIEGGQIEGLKEVLEAPGVAWLVERGKEMFNMEDADVGDLLVKNLTNMGRDMVGKITKGVKNLVGVMLNFVFMSLTIFFLFRDGTGFLARLRDYLPFPPEQRARLEAQVKGMVVSTIYGGVVVALVQGLLGGTAFYFLGVPSPVIWGTAIAIMSFVPMLGTFSIWGPMVVYLFLQGAIAKGFILLIIGTFGISMVDNILKPIIIGGRTKMHTLVIFFSVIGGIKLFGLIGLIMGPMSVALFISVFEIFRNIEGGHDAQPGRA
jgi:predicted PurR-regulated permease PerM